MTELEKLERARMYLSNLAQGVNPLTGEELPEDTVLNHVRLSRCFFYVTEVLDKLIANDGQVTQVSSRRKGWTYTHEEIAGVTVSDSPLGISAFARMVTDTIGDPTRKLTHTSLTAWLTDKGFLQQVETAPGRSRRGITPLLEQIGVWEELRVGPNGSYMSVQYGAEAQQFLLDNLEGILVWWNEQG